MKTNIAAGIILLLALIGGAAYYYMEHRPEVNPSGMEETSEADRRMMPAVEWSFRDNGYDESKSADTTTVTLTVDGTSHEVGTYLGSCAEVAESERPDGAISAALCWFAGAGDEIGLYIGAADELVVQKREIQEPTAESAEYRGALETVIRL